MHRAGVQTHIHTHTYIYICVYRNCTASRRLTVRAFKANRFIIGILVDIQINFLSTQIALYTQTAPNKSFEDNIPDIFIVVPKA